MKKLSYILIIAFISTFVACKDDNGSDVREFNSIDNSGSSGFTTKDGGGGKIGIGGSMAKFTIKDNYLYTLVGNVLVIYDISEPANPLEKRSLNLADDFRTQVETIFPYGSNLLFGTTTGMLVYDISNPEMPNYKGQFAHVMSCDPVVAENNIAYVTLRGGTECRGFINQLDVLDITNLTSPALIKTYPMTSPLGLGIDNNTLFVCDGNFLKIFDVAKPDNIIEIKKFEVKAPYDVIPLKQKKELILSAKGGIMQYDYSDIENIKLLSTLNVTN